MIKTTIALGALAIAVTGSPALTQTRAQIMSPQDLADLIGVYFAARQADRHKPGATKIDAGHSPLGGSSPHTAVVTRLARALQPAT